jgi:hypothetical protein
MVMLLVIALVISWTVVMLVVAVVSLASFLLGNKRDPKVDERWVELKQRDAGSSYPVGLPGASLSRRALGGRSPKGVNTMKFRGRLARSGKAFSISGVVEQQSNGIWEGSFNYSKKDATSIGVGEAQIIIDKGNAWKILVTGNHSEAVDDDAECFFTIQGDP